MLKPTVHVLKPTVHVLKPTVHVLKPKPKRPAKSPNQRNP
jgi:hypothetical protein